jgi:hypothetical protein
MLRRGAPQNRLYFAVLSAPENLRYSQLAASAVCFSVDNDLVRPVALRIGRRSPAGAAQRAHAQR